jgi:capsular exopolysaccharide synthesis family protein
VEIDLRQVIRALLRWWWTIVLLVALGGLAGYGLASLQAPSYSATTSLLVTTTLSSTLVEEGNRAETYRSLVESGPVLDRVILELGLEHDREELAAVVTPTVVMNTQIIEITVTDESPERAAEIANSVARNFENQVAELTVGQLQQNLEELQGQSADLLARQAEIDAQIAEIDTEANAENTEIQAEISALQSERLRVAQTIADLDSSIRSINEQLVTSTTPVAVADVATVAKQPESPRPMLIGILGAFLGGLIGLGLVALLEFMDTRIRRDDDIEAMTGSRLLAMLPAAKGGNPHGLFAVSHPDHATTEAVRMVRAHLAGQIARGGHNALVFTSPRGERTTSELVGNLGVLMAQSGIRTMILDTDLREPAQHTLFAAENETGLSSFLSGIDELVPAKTDVPNLQVLTAGPHADNPSEMISSARFAALVKAARDEAEVVLIDAPAMLTYSDALSAAAISDGVVLVARIGSTNRGDLQDAAAIIEDDGLHLVGTVVSE